MHSHKKNSIMKKQKGRTWNQSCLRIRHGDVEKWAHTKVNMRLMTVDLRSHHSVYVQNGTQQFQNPKRKKEEFSPAVAILFVYVQANPNATLKNRNNTNEWSYWFQNMCQKLELIKLSTRNAGRYIISHALNKSCTWLLDACNGNILNWNLKSSAHGYEYNIQFTTLKVYHLKFPGTFVQSSNSHEWIFVLWLIGFHPFTCITDCDLSIRIEIEKMKL